MTIKRDLELLYEVGCLRFNKRHWTRYLAPNFQNLAEHMFRVMWISLILAKYEGIKDTEKVLKIALLHDLSESRTVDVDYLSRLYVKRFEEKALNDSLHGTSLEEEFKKLFHEFEERKTKEAQIVRDADYLDTEIELAEQEASGHKLREVWKKFRLKTSKEKFYTKTAKKFWDAIQESNPHDWQVKARKGG
ncbi:HD domain-containing protein [Candidatus Dojkabacteria bacterium]|nr:HD domain-containing protein [Candidatus Dojkabacteria bacterium]